MILIFSTKLELSGTILCNDSDSKTAYVGVIC